MRVGRFVSDVDLRLFEIGSLRDIKLSDYSRNAITHRRHSWRFGDALAPTLPEFTTERETSIFNTELTNNII